MALVLTESTVTKIITNTASNYMMELIRSGSQELEGVQYEMALRTYYAAKYGEMPPDAATPRLRACEEVTKMFIEHYNTQKA